MIKLHALLLLTYYVCAFQAMHAYYLTDLYIVVSAS